VSVGEIILWWTVAAVGLAGSMLCSGMETGLYATNRVRALVRAKVGTRADRVVAGALEHPDRSLTTLLLFNNGFNYIATLAITALLVSLGLSDAALILLQAAVLTPVLLVFAESLPKELCRAHAEKMTRRLAPAMAAMQAVGVYSGLVPLISAMARLVGRLFGVDAAGALGSPRERVAELIKHGAGGGAMSEAQAGLIDRALRVEATRVGDEMIPLHAAVTVRSNWVAARARREVTRKAHARFPVLDERGHVVGVVRLADLVLQPGATVASIMGPVARLDHRVSAWEGLGVLRRDGVGMGVVERNGAAVGIVTQKDLVEPLTGDLRDW
jgi:putative hemolysin